MWLSTYIFIWLKYESFFNWEKSELFQLGSFSNSKKNERDCFFEDTGKATLIDSIIMVSSWKSMVEEQINAQRNIRRLMEVINWPGFSCMISIQRFSSLLGSRQFSNKKRNAGIQSHSIFTNSLGYMKYH